MEKILIADHEWENVNELESILKGTYEIETAYDIDSVVEILESQGKEIATVLYRFSMNDMDGYGFLQLLDKMGLLSKMPVLFINERGAAELEHGSIKMGVYDFVHKPFVAEVVTRRVSNLTTLFVFKRGLEQKVESQRVTMNKQFKLLKMQQAALARSKQNIVDILATVVECRSLESGDHINRIKGYTEIIANRMLKDYPETGLTEEMVSVIVSSSALHERIYSSENMCGILIYTGAADKEGSLGGLVELGGMNKFLPLLKGALENGLTCTTDPECFMKNPTSDRLNGAACHSCTMISETACENGNRLLDRALVVPVPEHEEMGYFRELVRDLCGIQV